MVCDPFSILTIFIFLVLLAMQHKIAERPHEDVRRNPQKLQGKRPNHLTEASFLGLPYKAKAKRISLTSGYFR